MSSPVKFRFLPIRLISSVAQILSVPMNGSEESLAFGGPGIEPRWTSSAKEGLGTSYHTSCRVWFTLSHGIVNEIYYPHVDQPNTRDFQFLISDGETFCHEEKRDFDHRVEYPERDCLLYRLINSERNGRYRVVKHVLTDPHRSVLLVHTKLEVADETLRGKLKMYALLAPHIARYGAGNNGWSAEVGGNELMCAERGGTYLVMGCSAGFSKRSVGYVGASDGWRDLVGDWTMDWQFRRAERGNLALTAEIRLDGRDEFMMGVGFGRSFQSTATKLLLSMAIPFNEHRNSFVRQWQRTVIDPAYDFSEHTSDAGGMYRLSRCVLLAHEDKVFQGALVASMSIPWGETKGDNDLGGYHLVWTRDLVQSASALLATGQTGTPLRALIWLASIQHPEGTFPQNSWIDGQAYWNHLQLDEIAAPILLAWRLQREKTGFALFDPWVMIARAAGYLVRQGPVTSQERWEENSGYSPSTLAMVIASLVCAAEFAAPRGFKREAEFLLSYADWLAANIESWMVTTEGELVEGLGRHYIRITPADAESPDPHPDPNTALVQLANGGGLHPARNVVSGDFLHLVRLGIRAADDPIILDSIKVMDLVLKRDLPDGACWRRYNHDGYGEKEDGSAFDGAGIGRCWPILTGERGHYELAAGRDPMSYIAAMEKFANDGGMMPEQLWDEPDTEEARMKFGQPTGAAMPLCWSHAEYLSLVRSRRDGVCFDRVEPAYQRYVVQPVKSRHSFWTFRHQLRLCRRGQKVRLVIEAPAEVVWSTNDWAESDRAAASELPLLKVWFLDLPTEKLRKGAKVEFTFYWTGSEKWEGKNWSILVE